MASILSIPATTHMELFEKGFHFFATPSLSAVSHSRPFLSPRRVIHVRVSAGYLVSLSMFAQSFEMCDVFVRACDTAATTASHRNTRESASFLRLLSTVRFSFAVRLPQLSARLLEAGQRHALPAVRHQRLQPEVQVLLQGQPLVEQPRPREGVLREGVLPLRPEAQLHGHLHG